MMQLLCFAHCELLVFHRMVLGNSCCGDGCPGSAAGTLVGDLSGGGSLCLPVVGHAKAKGVVAGLAVGRREEVSGT